MEAPGICGSWQALQEKGDHSIREGIPRIFLWWYYHGRWNLIEMNDRLTASSHPPWLSEKTLHAYLNPPPIPERLSATKLPASTLWKTSMAFPTTITYGFTARGSLLLPGWRMPSSYRKAKIPGKHSQNFTYQDQAGTDVYQLSNTQVLVLKSKKMSY